LWVIISIKGENMPVQLSDDVMRSMGFRPFDMNEAIAASFSSINIYEARGIILEDGATPVIQGTVENTNYKFMISASVNKSCLAMMGDVFCENEEEWKIENKCTGPFLLVGLGPTAEHNCSSGHIKTEEDGSIATYNCFSNARAEIIQLEEKVLPTVLTALTCAFNEDSHYVIFCKISRAGVGRTTTGQVLHDFHSSFHASGYSSIRLPQDNVAKKLNLVKQIAANLNSRTSRFFALALEEKDEVKKFLYFFLALEVETHAAFKRINHQNSLSSLLGTQGVSRSSAIQLLQNQTKQLKNLRDKFTWCAHCMWTNIQEEDVAEFQKLLKVRNDIAHGNISDPPHGFARKAELLAHKVLSH
jgi:hypothetical protein